MPRTLVSTVAAVMFLSATAFAQTAPAGVAARLLPGTRPNVLASIQGRAVNQMNGSLTDTMVRLRDARNGRIVGAVTTNKQGAFSFQGIDPGSYVVEVMTPAQNAVMASSPLLSVSSGEAISALVKLPFRIPAFAGLIGNSTQTTTQAVSTAAQAVTAAAASNSTVAETLAGAASTTTTTGNAR